MIIIVWCVSVFVRACFCVWVVSEEHLIHTRLNTAGNCIEISLKQDWQLFCRFSDNIRTSKLIVFKKADCDKYYVKLAYLLLNLCLFTISPSFFPSFQRQAKYSENKLKCTKARNDYLLNLAATNAVVAKYYIHDVSDMIDVSTASKAFKWTMSKPTGGRRQSEDHFLSISFQFLYVMKSCFETPMLWVPPKQKNETSTLSL